MNLSKFSLKIVLSVEKVYDKKVYSYFDRGKVNRDRNGVSDGGLSERWSLSVDKNVKRREC